jgi:hypothetical protein
MPSSKKQDNSLEADWNRIRARSNTGGKGHVRHLVSMTFGHLVVLSRSGSDKNGASLWLCRCGLCGAEKVYSRPALTGGRVKSCGCLRASLVGKPRPKPEPPSRASRIKRTVWERLLEEEGEIPQPTPRKNSIGLGMSLTLKTYQKDPEDRD